MTSLAANSFLLCLLLSSGQMADPDDPQAAVIYACDFEPENDINHDAWPDDWTRRRGREYPTYVKIGISDTQDDARGSAIQIKMDGGSAAVFSPPIAVHPQYTYIVEAAVRTASLKHSQAKISLSFFNQERKLVGRRRYSPEHTGGDKWSTIKIGPLSANEETAQWAVIGLHVQRSGRGSDFTGEAWFDAIRMSQLPRVLLTTNRAHNVFATDEEVEVSCDVSGISAPNPLLRLEIYDVFGQAVTKKEVRLDGMKMQHRAAAQQSTGANADASFHGKFSWNPQLPGRGFYRVHLRIDGSDRVLFQRAINLAVLAPHELIQKSEFGWSLADGAGPLDREQLTELLRHTGCGWLKYPLWFSSTDNREADALAAFIEKLSSNGVQVVGVIDQPPADLRELFGGNDERLPAALVFSDPSNWFPAINPVLTRLSLKVPWWQLGNDQDTSFTGRAQLSDTMWGIRQKLERYGQEIHLGFAWPWLRQPPGGDPSWSFYSLQSGTPLTAGEIETYLAELPPQAKGRRWVMLKPLPKGQYSLPVRSRDLVQRMLAAKLGQAESVFATAPFDAETGLMNPDGTPSELFIPWCTTAKLLSGANFMGSLALPGGSENFVFRRGDQTMMIVWNDRPTRETINLGDQSAIQHSNLWGSPLEVDAKGHRQVYQIGPTPTIIQGIRRELVQWRLDFQFTDSRLATVFQQPQYKTAKLHNSFLNPADGEMTIHLPRQWGAQPPPLPIKLSGGETIEAPFEITLKTNASNGKQRLQIDFNISTDREYQFSVWREMEVGDGQVSMEFSTRADPQGRLIVEQTLVNESDRPVTFKCLLFTPGRRRLRHNVVNLAPGRDVRQYVLADADELKGQTLWVYAEEIGGARVLNYRFPAQP